MSDKKNYNMAIDGEQIVITDNGKLVARIDLAEDVAVMNYKGTANDGSSRHFIRYDAACSWMIQKTMGMDVKSVSKEVYEKRKAKRRAKRAEKAAQKAKETPKKTPKDTPEAKNTEEAPKPRERKRSAKKTATTKAAPKKAEPKKTSTAAKPEKEEPKKRTRKTTPRSKPAAKKGSQLDKAVQEIMAQEEKTRRRSTKKPDVSKSDNTTTV